MLFTSYHLGTLELSNRMVMPAMTRSRAGAGHVFGGTAADHTDCPAVTAGGKP